MNRRTVILWALGAGQLLAAAIGFAVSEWASNQWIVTTGQVVVVSQFYLAGIWVALGRRSSPWRLVAVGMLLTCLTRLLDGQQYRDIIFLFSPGVLTTLGTLLLLRVLGFRLQSQVGEPQPGNAGKFQFSLRSILIWTAVIAILFSLASLAHPDIAQTIEHVTLQELLAFFLPIHLLFTGVCVAEMAIILGMRRPWIGLALILPIVLALFGLLGWWTQSQVAELVWVGVCAMLWFVISLVPLRLLGYRFGRCNSPPETERNA